MTLLFTDGFDAGDMLVKWVPTQNALTNTTFPAGRLGGLCASKSVDGQRAFTPSATVILGIAINYGVQGSNGNLIKLSADSGATVHLSLQFNNATGAISLYRGNGSTLLATSAAGVFQPNTWFYLEMKATCADTGGIAIVRVNETEVINFTGDTKNAGTSTNFDTLWVRYDGGNGGQSFDDLYVFNGLGTVNNDFNGDSRIQTLVSNGAGSNTQLTPSVAPNWDCVNELPYSATDYVSGSTVGNKDTYATTDLPAGYTIQGVQLNAIAKKTDAGTRNLKTTLRSGGTDYSDATAVSLGTADKTITSVRERDPNGSIAWTQAAINAMEIGVEVA